MRDEGELPFPEGSPIANITLGKGPRWKFRIQAPC